jgi:hypothetical protein
MNGYQPLWVRCAIPEKRFWKENSVGDHDMMHSGIIEKNSSVISNKNLGYIQYFFD